MKETETQCSVCKRYLTPEELVKNKQQQKPVAEAKCYYCYVDALNRLNSISDVKYPVPHATDFGRDEAEAAQIRNDAASNVETETDTADWPPELVEHFKELGIDLTKKIEVVKAGASKKNAAIPPVQTPSFASHKLTQIAARGTTEDVSLVFTVPRELVDPRLAPAIQNGLNTILMSLMNMLAFAPLHNGVMQNILQPPPPNPFGLPGGGPPNLFE